MTAIDADAQDDSAGPHPRSEPPSSSRMFGVTADMAHRALGLVDVGHGGRSSLDMSSNARDSNGDPASGNRSINLSWMGRRRRLPGPCLAGGAA